MWRKHEGEGIIPDNTPPMASKKKRLDQVVVDRGWSESRSQARALIMAGKVWYGTERMTKPGAQVPSGIDLHLERAPRFVGRGGEKMEAFLDSANFVRCNRSVIVNLHHLESLKQSGKDLSLKLKLIDSEIQVSKSKSQYILDLAENFLSD